MGKERTGAAHLYYALAILIPVAGFLVGLALIARGDEDGPWVIGYSVGSSVIYTVALYLALGA